MLTFFLPPTSVIEFPAIFLRHKEINDGTSHDTEGRMDRPISALAVDSIDKNYFLTDIHKMTDSIHDHNEQAFWNPKRKKWRNTRRRAAHRTFNFLHMKELAKAHTKNKLPFKRPRESHRNPKINFDSAQILFS